MLQQILAASNQNNQNLDANLFQNIRQINDPRQFEENRNMVNVLLAHSCLNLTEIQNLINSTDIADIQIQYEILGQKETRLRHLFDRLNQQIQTISQINPLMAQQLAQQLKVIQRQGENIHHHEAGPSHQVQAGVGPSHYQEEAGPSHHQGEAGPSHQFHAGDAPRHFQGNY
ncbi:unnamed protein product [Meloidogyne enterolobii]|uniref:Uncharacterized protein n=1 Tax=Meloidogyne enterolobii TaxID=390850 RepID=A0ACB0Y604_MELEN